MEASARGAGDHGVGGIECVETAGMGVDLEGAGDEAEGPREQLLGAIEVAGDVSDIREVEEDGSDVAVVGAAGSLAVATRRCGHRSKPYDFVCCR